MRRGLLAIPFLLLAALPPPAAADPIVVDCGVLVPSPGCAVCTGVVDFDCVPCDTWSSDRTCQCRMGDPTCLGSYEVTVDDRACVGARADQPQPGRVHYWYGLRGCDNLNATRTVMVWVVKP